MGSAERGVSLGHVTLTCVAYIVQVEVDSAVMQENKITNSVNPLHWVSIPVVSAQEPGVVI